VTSTARATRLLIERLTAGTTLLVSQHVEVSPAPAWADGADADGRAVQLVGAHQLRALPSGDAVVAEVLTALKAGEVLPGVHALGYHPAASAGYAAIMDGPALADPLAIVEVLTWGSRGSGKTVVVAGSTLGLAEAHARGGYPLPLRGMYLHGSLIDASKKTGVSLEEPFWGGIWRLEENRTRAVARLGGTDYVVLDFVGVHDVQAQERLRASAHVVLAEELVATLDDLGGIPLRAYEVSLTSLMRLAGRRRVAISTTNPGSREHWSHQRFLGPDRGPTRIAVHVPSRDRLSGEEIRVQGTPFANSPDLKARLVDEQWVDLKLGPEVASGYDPAKHVASAPLRILPQGDVWMGWDSGPGAHRHATVIAQRNGPHIRIFAGLLSENTGLKQHLERLVLPWMAKRMAWLLNRETALQYLTHAIDPAMDVDEGGDIDQSPKRRLRETLGGRVIEGLTAWAGRLGPLLAQLGTGDGEGGWAIQIDPGPDTELLRRALAGAWHYDVTRGGATERDAPAKNEAGFADLGDALLYLLGAMKPSKPARVHSSRQSPKFAISRSAGTTADGPIITTTARREPRPW
jgi:hypothetical protein